MRHPVDYAPSQDFGDNPTSILPASHWIIQQFGNYQPDGHTGTDYPCPIGTPIRAVADGTVLHVGRLTGTYADNPWWISPGFAGYVAVIDHGHFIGIYGHCLDGSAGVRPGDRVAEGDVFIRSGNTGASTGPHLHFEALPDGYVLNSYMYGRINPANLFGLSSQGDITPTSEEDDLMATPEQRQELIRELLDTQVDQAGGGKVTFREHLAENRRQHQDQIRVTETVISQPFQRFGTDGKPQGETTIKDTLGTLDANIVIDRSLFNKPVTVVVDSLIAADIAKEVLDLLAVRLAE